MTILGDYGHYVLIISSIPALALAVGIPDSTQLSSHASMRPVFSVAALTTSAHPFCRYSTRVRRPHSPFHPSEASIPPRLLKVTAPRMLRVTPPNPSLLRPAPNWLTPHRRAHRRARPQRLHRHSPSVYALRTLPISAPPSSPSSPPSTTLPAPAPEQMNPREDTERMQHHPHPRPPIACTRARFQLALH
ncbi:hypothetical protein B0H13DRAFT_1083690 [Mycena leptocephala]|nr:hypothetical protein B0H13DRAFT_1083690 [Mycena leptocephala]